MRISITMLMAASLGLLVACAGPPVDARRTEVVLPLNRAWVEGRQVEYVTTDVSDAAMARMAGVNYVPRLADAIGHAGQRTLAERVYKFAGDAQISIFASAPQPTGAANADLNYSPLWRVVMVQWLKKDRVHEIKSEEELLSAEDAGDVSLQLTNIVVNCPITRGADGQALRGGR